MPKRPFRAGIWAAWKSLLSGVKEVADSTPRTAVDHPRAVPTANATTAKRLATLPATAAAEGDPVLALTSVVPVMAATVSAPAQAAIPDTTEVAEVAEGPPEATVPHPASMRAVTTGETETTVIDARKGKEREAATAKEDRAQGAPNEEMVVPKGDHLATSGSKEIVAPVRPKGTVKIALREALRAA